MKHCNTCNKTKEKSEFGKRSASKDGLANKCKECQSEYDKKRANNPDRVKARELYQKTDAGRAAMAKAKKKWAESNIVKRAANVMVGNAVRDGRLEKPKSCSKCGTEGRIHGHHDDYARPLDVRWLCSRCHSDWHKKNSEAKNAS